nr:MAG TPA: hypothetical protein [Caudoviricetes sp.]
MPPANRPRTAGFAYSKCVHKLLIINAINPRINLRVPKSDPIFAVQ